MVYYQEKNFDDWGAKLGAAAERYTGAEFGSPKTSI